jgi:hypothetical protein
VGNNSLKHTLDTTPAILTYIIEWVWAPILGFSVFTFLRLLGLEERVEGDKSEDDTRHAVHSTRLGGCESRVSDLDDKNREDHTRILEKIDKHHAQVTERLDRIISTIRNNGRGTK